MTSLFDQGPPPPCPAFFNMAAHVLALADSQPDKIALSVLSLSGSERWSYARMKAAVLGTGTGLLQAGLNPGDRVLMRLGNTVEFPIAYLGAIAVGLIPVPTSSQLTEGETAKMVADLTPGAIPRDPSIACPDTPGIPQILLDDLEAMRDLPPAEIDMGDPDRMAYIIYTSGTSGIPRAVCHAHRAIWARQMMHEGWYGLKPTDRLLHAGAFNWTYTLGTGLMDPWSVGATALIPAQGVDIKALPLLLKRHQATIFAAAPGVYRKMLSDHPDIHLPDLRHGLTAGEKLSETIREEWFEATGTALYEAYGMSECSTFISASPANPAHPGTLGRPQDGRRIAIVDENGPVPLGNEGTIAVHRSDPGLMLGYLNAPEETAAKFQGDWFLTGDQGVMDDDFYITYAGRADDMMNAGGYRVSPLEVEAALSRFPGITAVGVTDIEIKRDARIIAAFYTSAGELDETALKAYAEQTLARYKQPKLFQRLDALPTNPNGKLSRRALRDQFEAKT
ncbi:class I adenylate-forming enzyme family protein [Shimia aestuarii]|uniref:Acyl-CoA synthetase (AMP-forming)/AMP-acid ligase II n=1 Tax=Shimia aestuarii TaxID=254406 RepID=A0A1I4NJX4_9RHOB|nr:class I adenylate-forming enzyme family protein [Shimia aestuarii]SFM15759.1 Acyl-CoA synthetase (AMP-forming)/AMP-acid ligase II [Shimia aestuarii]